MSAPDYSKWKLNHTMIRIKDPKRTVAFYNQLGLKQIAKLEFPEAQFDSYFLAYNYLTSESGGNQRSDREGVLEVTHNYGTESDDNYKSSNGNDDPLGFSHIGISVDNIQAARRRLEDMGVKWHEKFQEGLPHRGLIFDPDGYHVELVTRDHQAGGKETTTNVETYRLNNTAFRVKDPQISLQWYSEVLGMILMRTVEQDDRVLYSIGYPGKRGDPEPDDTNYLADREGLIELIWIKGSEKKEGKIYHNGNNMPQGFGHIAISVDDIQALCHYLEATNKVHWKKRLTDGRMKSIAFILDPDDYWIEFIQNASIKEPLGVQ